MRPAAERKAELADELSKARTADQIAAAIVDSIDQALRDRGRLGRRDRSREEDERQER